MVRPGASLRDPPDASLCHLLLPQGDGAEVCARDRLWGLFFQPSIFVPRPFPSLPLPSLLFLARLTAENFTLWAQRVVIEKRFPRNGKGGSDGGVFCVAELLQALARARVCGRSIVLNEKRKESMCSTFVGLFLPHRLVSVRGSGETCTVFRRLWVRLRSRTDRVPRSFASHPNGMSIPATSSYGIKANTNSINGNVNSAPRPARPYDARMWIALAQCLEKMDKRAEAISTYERVREIPCGLLE